MDIKMFDRNKGKFFCISRGYPTVLAVGWDGFSFGVVGAGVADF